MTHDLVLPDEQFAKAVVYMRALRRAVIAFWYATIEDLEAALIEAAQACFVVNILDEAVFEHALGEPYRQNRAKDRLGQVVTGLELIRNCETHAHVGFGGLLVGRRVLGVPMHGRKIYRVVPSWAEYVDLPSAYVELNQSATPNQKRARGEAQHGYRHAIAGRSVLETLLDAIAFFQKIDPRLVVEDGPVLRFWVERASQVWRDVRNGYCYFVAHDDQQVDVVENGHQRVAALLADGTDLLAGLPDGDEPHADIDRLKMVETYPDLYLTMREQ